MNQAKISFLQSPQLIHESFPPNPQTKPDLLHHFSRLRNFISYQTLIAFKQINFPLAMLLQVRENYPKLCHRQRCLFLYLSSSFEAQNKYIVQIMLTENVARSLGFIGNFNAFALNNVSFFHSEPIWHKQKSSRAPPELTTKNHQFTFYKLGKTLGFETNRYIEYKDGVLYYYEGENDDHYKGYCFLQNLYLYYFKVGYQDVLYLTNGTDASTFYFQNGAFMSSISSRILKDVVQVNFKQKYKLIEEIGEGTFSKVYLTVNRYTGKKYAAKVVPKIDTSGFVTKGIVQEEKKILKHLNSELVCQMFEFFQDNDCYVFVLEYLSGKDLSKIMKECKEMPLNDNIYILKQILKSLELIHSQNIIHRDLKPHNIVVKIQQKSVKLIDFGLSLLFNPNTEVKKFMRCGTMGYIAPEVVNNNEVNRKKYDTQSDMFSFGIIAHMLLMGNNPIRGKTYKETSEKNMKCDFVLDKKSILLRYGSICYEFLASLLDKDPKKRPTATEALKNPFLELKHKDQDTVTNSQALGQDLMKEHKHDEANYIEDKEFMITTSKVLNFNNSSGDLSPNKKTAASWMSQSKFS